ncbi:MAG: gliding motility protein GldM [Bacteroidia bacterium]
MAGAKLSPRQKMINMMYLVLIALLAMNVSKEILKSFFYMEQSFIAASSNIDEKNKTTMDAFQKKMEENAAKTRPYFERAQEAEKITAGFISFIDEKQAMIEEMYGGRADGPNSPLEAADRMEHHANYFVKKDQGKNGTEFMAKINETRDALLELLKPDPQDTNITIKDLSLYNEALSACQLHAEDEKSEGLSQKGWIEENLEHNPSAGLMALFARIKNDAKTLESDVLTKLAQQIDATDYKFDKLTATVLAKSSAIMSGGQYEADILLVASNTKGQPVIKVGGEEITIVNGVGKYAVAAVGTGMKSFAGEILVSGPQGEQSFPFEAEYQVFKPAATIAATEMNLLYVGLDNPMSISVPGFTDIRVSSSGGLSLSNKGGGSYNAKVDGSAREVTISVSVTADGKTKHVGSEKFRVRRLPNPTAQLGGLPNDGLPKAKAQVQAQSSLIATMGQGFAYNLAYRVTQFRFIYAPARRPATMVTGNGSALTSQMRSMIGSAKKGDRILIEGIKAKEAKYGFSANLSPIVITIR